MAVRAQSRQGAMATRWRRRQLCQLGGAPATLLTLSATDLLVETGCRPALDQSVVLDHPEAGSIVGLVTAHHMNGVTLRLDGSINAVAFALAATASDMTLAA